MPTYRMEVNDGRLEIEFSKSLTIVYAHKTNLMFAKIPYHVVFGKKDENLNQQLTFDIEKSNGEEKMDLNDLMKILNRGSLDNYGVNIYPTSEDAAYIPISKLTE